MYKSLKEYLKIYKKRPKRRQNLTVKPLVVNIYTVYDYLYFEFSDFVAASEYCGYR
jgi:hypothetical protein